MVVASSPLEFGWIAVTLVSLSLAAYFDWKTRIIPDKIWLSQLVISVIMLIIWFFQNPSLTDIILVFANITMGFLLMFVLVFTGTMAGGDIKAFFVISISYPLSLTLIDPIFSIPVIFPSLFSLLLNFLFLYVLLALSFFTYNFIQILLDRSYVGSSHGTIPNKVRLLFDSIRVSTDNIEKRAFYNPAEFLVGGRWVIEAPQLDLLMDDDEWDRYEKEEREEMMQNIADTKKDFIWIRPQIPGIPILWMSFILSIIIGPILGPLFGFITT